MDKLRDELRGAGGRWNAEETPIFGLAVPTRRQLLLAAPGDDELLVQRCAVARLARTQRRERGGQASGDCRPLRERVEVRAGGIELETAPAMRQWLVQRGPLVALFAVHEDFYAYVNGVYHHVAGTLEGAHRVVVVGFDEGGDYWIAENGWGPDWGEAGCFRIACGQRGIDASMWGVDAHVQ